MRSYAEEPFDRGGGEGIEFRGTFIPAPLAQLAEAEQRALQGEAENQTRREVFLEQFPERDSLPAPTAFRFNPAAFEILPPEAASGGIESKVAEALSSLEDGQTRNLLPAMLPYVNDGHRLALLQQVARHWYEQTGRTSVLFDMTLLDEKGALPSLADFSHQLQQQFAVHPDILVAVHAPQRIHWRALLADLPNEAFPQLPVAIMVPEKHHS